MSDFNVKGISSEDIKLACRVLEIEERAILDLKNRLDKKFVQSLDLIENCRGKIVFTGMGKSGIIARKIASTFSSTGTPSCYLHPAESSHGDLGLVASEDIVVAISYSGETKELEPLVSYVVRKNIPLIVLAGKPKSFLVKSATVFLDVSVKEEACPLGLAPTASTTATLALGDALAMCLLKRKGFQSENFAELHPHGSLGARLLTRIKDVMHTGDALPLVTQDVSMKDVISIMTGKEVRGVAGIINDNKELIGIITDGDLRRSLSRSENPLLLKVKDIHSTEPKTIDKEELVEKALFLMEDFKIQSLFVVDKTGVNANIPVGILHFQDLLKSKVR